MICLHQVVKATIGAVCALLSFVPLAHAQDIVQPPVATIIDANGVNLATGKIQLPNLDIGIGSGDSGLARATQTGTGGITDNFTGHFSLAAPPQGQTGFTYHVSYGGTLYRFAVPVTGSQITPGPYFALESGKEKFNCTALDPNAVGSCTLILTEGTKVTYSRTVAYTLSVITEVAHADGEIRSFTYHLSGNQPKAIKSVSSSLGWMLKYEVDGNYKIIKVTALNTAATYCDPAASACAASSSFPTTTFSINGGTTTIVRNGVNLVSYSTSGLVTTLSTPSGVTKAITLYESTHANYGLVKQITAGGITWNYSYVRSGGSINTTITDPNGNTRTTRINSSGKVTSTTDEAGRTTTYLYGTAGVTSGLLIRVTNPDGNSQTGGFTKYDYDNEKRVTKVTVVPKGGATNGVVDTTKALITTAIYDNACIDDASRKYCLKPTSVTDSNGVTTEYTYHLPTGMVATETTPPVNSNRAQTRYTYAQLTPYVKNAGGTLIAQPQVWKLTETSTCMTGNLSACVNSVNERKTIISYNSNNLLPTDTTTKLGNNTLSQTVTITYNDNGLPIVADGPKPGAVDETYSMYDDLGRQIAGVGLDPDTTDTTRQRPASKTYYDSDSRARKVEAGTVPGSTYSGTTALARHAQATTDLSGFSIIETDTIEFAPVTGFVKIARSYIGGEAGTPKYLTQRTYDNMGRLSCEAERLNPNAYGVSSLPASACTMGTVNADGTKDRITQYNYHPVMGMLTSVTTGVGTANARNEYTKTFDVGTTTSTGTLTSIIDAKGNKTSYSYDGFNRLFKTCYPTASNGATTNPSDCETTTYKTTTVTGISQATQMAGQITLRDGTSTITFGYDGMSRVSSKSGAAVEALTYNNFGQVTTRSNSTPGHTINGNASTSTYVYNALGWVLSDQQSLGTVSYEYDAYGKRTKLTYPGGFYVSYVYNSGDELTRQCVNTVDCPAAATPILRYNYNNTGQRWRLLRDGGPTTTYNFDSEFRLTGLNNPINAITLTYSAADQIASRTNSYAAINHNPSPQSLTSYTINGLNQVTNVGTSPALGYDTRGNLTSDGAVTYTYNVNNLLTSTSSGATLSYDAENRLARTARTGFSTQRFLYDGVDLIAEYDDAGTLLYRYVHGPGMDEPLIWYANFGDHSYRYLLSDERGSITGTTNPTGSLQSYYTYNEYGAPSAGNNSRFQYTGQTWLPEVGLYYYKARLYSPSLGRFMQTDPIGYGDGMNWYAYVRNDPVNNTDPSGLSGDNIETVTVVGNQCQSGAICLTGQAARDYLRSAGDSGLMGDLGMLALYFGTSKEEVLVGIAHGTCSTITADIGASAIAGTGGKVAVGGYIGAGRDDKLHGGFFLMGSGSTGFDVSAGANLTWINGTFENVEGASTDACGSVFIFSGCLGSTFDNSGLGVTYYSIGVSAGLDDAFPFLGFSGSVSINGTGTFGDRIIPMSSAMQAASKMTRKISPATNCKKPK